MEVSQPKTEFSADKHFHGVAENFAEMLKTGHLSDVVIVAEGQQFKCHKIILSAGCGYFSGMFRSGMLETKYSQITIHEIEADTMDTILQYIYTGKATFEDSNALKLLYAANMFGLDELLTICARICRNIINADNCFEFIQLCNSVQGLSDEDTLVLSDLSEEFIIENFAMVRNKEEWLYMELDNLVRIIGAQWLHIKCEEHACDLVLKWLKHDNNKSHIREALLGTIRLENLGKSYISSKLLKNKLIRSSDIFDIISSVYDHVTSNTGLPPELPAHSLRWHTDNIEGIMVLGFHIIEQTDIYTSSELKFAKIILDEFDVNLLEPVPLDCQFASFYPRAVAMCSSGSVLYLSGFPKEKRAVYEYSPVSKVWKQRLYFEISRSSHHLVMGSNFNLYSLGGGDIMEIEQLDLTTRRCSIVGNLVKSVHAAAGCIYYKNKIFMFVPETGSSKTQIQMFDTKTQECTMLNTYFNGRVDSVVKFRNMLIGLHEEGSIYACFVINMDDLPNLSATLDNASMNIIADSPELNLSHWIRPHIQILGNTVYILKFTENTLGNCVHASLDDVLARKDASWQQLTDYHDSVLFTTDNILWENATILMRNPSCL